LASDVALSRGREGVRRGGHGPGVSRNSPRSGTTCPDRADNVVMNRAQDVSPTTATLSETRYGLAPSAFERAWDIETIQSYLGIGRTQAYALAKDPSFPRRLRTGRAHRWNGLQVVAWAHHDDWREVDFREPASTRHEAADVATLNPAAAHRVGSEGPSVVTTLTRARAASEAASLGTPDLTAPGPRRVIDPQQVHQRLRDERVAQITEGRAQATVSGATTDSVDTKRRSA
jgi:predicted DNA-binding transcriptional regulator AlpA